MKRDANGNPIPDNQENTPATPPDAQPPAFDAATMARTMAEAFSTVLDEKLEKRAAEPADIKTMPNMVPDAEKDAGTRGQANKPKVTGQRDTDGPDGVNVQTHRLLKSIALRQPVQTEQVQQHMKRAGMYDGAAFNKFMGEDVKDSNGERAINLTSSEGQPFLPTTVDNRIEEIRENFGAMRQVCTVFDFSAGSHKVPNVSGRPKVFAVNEGSPIKARKATWGSVTLDPFKWGLIVPYSSEMNDEVGAQWVAKSTEQAGRSFAEMEDETVLIADGTAAYHSLTGIIAGLAGVVQHTLPTGDTSFNDWSYAQGIEAMKVTPAGNRSMGAHVLHPDMQLVMATFVDPANQYIYPPNTEPERLVRRVVYTEAMPDITDDAVSTNFHAFGDFSFVTMGFQRGVTAKLLDQATILDTDDTTEIHLGASDSLAIRFTARWDVKIGLPAAFSKSRTAAS